MIHQRQDGQIDDMRSQDRALHYSASRGKNLSLELLLFDGNDMFMNEWCMAQFVADKIGQHAHVARHRQESLQLLPGGRLSFRQHCCQVRLPSVSCRRGKRRPGKLELLARSIRERYDDRCSARW